MKQLFSMTFMLAGVLTLAMIATIVITYLVH